MIRRLQRTEAEEDAKKLREDMQYGSKTKLEKNKCEVLMANAIKFVEKMRVVLEELN